MSAPAAVTTAVTTAVRVDDPTDPVPSFIASPDTFRDAFLRRVEVTIAKHIDDCRRHDLQVALAYAVRDAQVDRWIATSRRIQERNPKRVYYISLEFLMGRALGNALINLGIHDSAETALRGLGLDLEELLDEELDAGLGNGGLGRLAACFLDSMATLDYPGFGCGIRYDYGIFKQRIVDGAQVEEPDPWLRSGNPWEIQRTDRQQTIRFFGRVQTYRDNRDPAGKVWYSWTDTEDVLAMPYDTPVPGYGTTTVNTLRLWSARALHDFNLGSFNRGDYINANLTSALTENITKVLYPNDNNYEGKELRLKQQYFVCAATIADLLADFKAAGNDIRALADKVAIQLNDTHPAIAIPELLRILVDTEGLGWDEAWGIVTRTFAYTNHTLLAEALEKWPVALFEKLLPRHLQLIYEINHHFLRQVANRWPGDDAKLRNMSLIEEGTERKVRMAYLAIVGSFSVNGVAALHTELLKSGLVNDFFQLSPAKFNNKTNGITPRRWLRACNPGLSALIDSKIGPSWTTDLDRLHGLEAYADDAAFSADWQAVKAANKDELRRYIESTTGQRVDPSSIFDVQIKRLHEYKRQLLNLLHCVALYQELKDNPSSDRVPRTVLFGAKAAPGYAVAKLIIRFANAVGRAVNKDPQVNDQLKVLFLPNYNVSLAELLIPAADLSQQISTAGKEASGTGNMKLALNGALTIGTLDGANVEIRDCVGEDNIYIFGNTVDEIAALRARGYDPNAYLGAGSPLGRALDLVRSGFFSPEDHGAFVPLVELIVDHGDEYFLAADFDSYAAAQRHVETDYRDGARWTSKAIHNVANMGMFSSDRTIRAYATEIWGVEPLR